MLHFECRDDNRCGVDAYKLDSIIRLNCTLNIMLFVGIIKSDRLSVFINHFVLNDIEIVDKDLEKVYKDLDNF